MRNIVLVALLIALAMVVGCKPKESKPTESNMSSMDTKTMEQPAENMQQAPEAMGETAAAPEAMGETAAAPEAMGDTTGSTETPESGDSAGTSQ